MWDLPQYKNKSHLNAWKRNQRERAKQRNRPTLHIRRTLAELRVFEQALGPSKIIVSRLVLNDLSPIGVYVFSQEPVRAGSRLALAMQAPLSFFARGKVLSCQPTLGQVRVLSESPYKYRVTVLFEFDSKEELQLVEEFVARLRSELCPPKAA